MAERAWRGGDQDDFHPFRPRGIELAEITTGVGFVAAFANVSVFDTESGLVLVDCGHPAMAQRLFDEVRHWSAKPVELIVYTHGHVDHVFGSLMFDREADANGWPRPRVVAHSNVGKRFDRYRLTAGLNTEINRRQFQIGLAWPTEYRHPDETYQDRLGLEVGGLRLELCHGRGETDDHTWVWLPQRGVLCTGDFFIWACPNAGNPQKVQRYAGEWAEALRAMDRLDAEILLPGHGLPIIGAARVHQALREMAELLESLQTQTLRLMNEGATLNRVLQAVRAPAELLERPYLRPIYDDPEFIVRNIWRLYGGWYDGNPAHLMPAPDAELAAEVATLAGGAEALAERARELARQGRTRLAAHLARMAVQSSLASRLALEVEAEVFERRSAEESSLMARNIYAAAADEARRALARH
jgi:alkyl sulfatase BDS1-like metallo-beta-lactamase superfamily hydrolase